jgi:hypothetical protein
MPKQSSSGLNFWQLMVFGILCFLLPGLVVAGILGFALVFNGGQVLSQPEIQLPVELIAAVLALIGSLAFLVLVFNQLQLTSKDQALGLPDGSIRAILAVSLIFLFLIMSVFLYAAVAKNSATSPSLDIAKQLVTTVATLAVSVAGFYFGAASVQSATAAVTSSPQLRVTDPTGTITFRAGDTTPHVITLATTPAGLAIDGRQIGDPGGQLIPTSSTSFTYTPSSKPSPDVVLLFSLAGNPQVTANVDVKVSS